MTWTHCEGMTTELQPGPFKAPPLSSQENRSSSCSLAPASAAILLLSCPSTQLLRYFTSLSFLRANLLKEMSKLTAPVPHLSFSLPPTVLSLCHHHTNRDVVRDINSLHVPKPNQQHLTWQTTSSSLTDLIPLGVQNPTLLQLLSWLSSLNGSFSLSHKIGSTPEHSVFESLYLLYITAPS